jgi:hypothetical protein
VFSLALFFTEHSAVVDPGLDESVLIKMVRASMRAVDEVYDLIMSSRAAGIPVSPEGRLPELDECLFRLGLLQVEDKDDATTSVWLEKADAVVLAPDGSLKASARLGWIAIANFCFAGGECQSAHLEADV